MATYDIAVVDTISVQEVINTYSFIRFPIVGGDYNIWGGVLTDWALTEHKAGGTHNSITSDSIITKGPMVDVRAFGAVGDNVHDDTSALQAAIDASEWKSLYIPSGKYKITAALELDGEKGYNIFGDGWDVRSSNSGTIIKNAGTENTINITTAGTSRTAIDQEFNMIRISNIMLLGTYPTSGGGLYTQNVHNLFLDHMFIKSHGNSGLSNVNGYGFKMTNCFVALNGNHGVNINNRGNLIVILGCDFSGNARNDGNFANLKLGMTGTPGEDENLQVAILGSQFALPGKSGDLGFHTAHCIIVQSTLNLTFIGNYVETVESDGYLFTADATCRNMVIDSNYFQDGNFLLNKCLKSRVTNNTFRKVDTDTSMTITADAGDGNNVVRGNRLVNGATEVFNNFRPFPRGQLGESTSETWNPVEIVDGDSLDSPNITVTGAALGDIAFASLEVDLVGLVLTAAVTAPNVVVCTLTNSTGSPVTLADSTLNVRVFQIVQSGE